MCLALRLILLQTIHSHRGCKSGKDWKGWWDALSQTFLLMTLRPAWDTLASGDFYTCIAWDECTSTEALQTPVQQATWQRKGHVQPCLTAQSLPRRGIVSGSWCSLPARELATGKSAVSTGSPHAIS